MNLKILYKNEIIKDINLDDEFKYFYKKSKLGISPIKLSMELIKSLIDIDLDDYVFGKEFILYENKLIIVLRENDYKYIIREEKINSLIK
jgi:hypothetical protein